MKRIIVHTGTSCLPDLLRSACSAEGREMQPSTVVDDRLALAVADVFHRFQRAEPQRPVGEGFNAAGRFPPLKCWSLYTSSGASL